MAGSRPSRSDADGTLTVVQCEWFPDLPPAMETPDPWRRGEENRLETEMRLFGSAVRTAFNQLAGGLTGAARGKPATASATGAVVTEPAVVVEAIADRTAALRLECKQGLQTAFGLNSRYTDDAILKANEVVASQRKLIPMEIAETEAKRERTERKRKANVRKAERFEAAGRKEEAATIRRVIHRQELRLAKLDAERTEYRRHRAEGTIPRVVFGGRHLWRRLYKSVGREHARLRRSGTRPTADACTAGATRARAGTQTRGSGWVRTGAWRCPRPSPT